MGSKHVKAYLGREIMKISQLRYFCKVYQMRNISKAAEALYVSQPAISTSIRMLEQELQVMLFFRNHNRLTPTNEGIYFYELAINLLKQVDNVPLQMRHLASHELTITIGLPPISSAFYLRKLPMIKKAYEKEHPNVTIELKEFHSFDSVPLLLENGGLSLAFSTLDECSFQGLEKITLFQTPIMLCVSPDHPLAGEKSVNIRQFQNEQIVRIYHSMSAIYRIIDDYFARYNAIPNYKFFFTQPEAVKSILIENKAVMLDRPEMLTIDNNLVFIPLEDPLSVDVGVIWNGKQPIGDKVANFIELLRQVDFRTKNVKNESLLYVKPRSV